MSSFSSQLLEMEAAHCSQISLVAQVTQHWFRHLLATNVMATSGNLRAAMDQGGWLTAESVTAYTHDVPALRRQVIEGLAIGKASPSLTIAETKEGKA